MATLLRWRTYPAQTKIGIDFSLYPFIIPSIHRPKLHAYIISFIQTCGLFLIYLSLWCILYPTRGAVVSLIAAAGLYLVCGFFCISVSGLWCLLYQCIWSVVSSVSVCLICGVFCMSVSGLSCLCYLCIWSCIGVSAIWCHLYQCIWSTVFLICI